MKWLKYFLPIVFILLLAGCPARSLFPLFSTKDIVFNPSLLGTWSDSGANETYTFQRSGEKSYNVIFFEQQSGNTTVYRAQLGRLGKLWFLDSYPAKGPQDYHLIPAHIISRISLNGDTLRIASLESDWLRQMIDSRELEIEHVRIDGDVILSASTEALKDLVQRFAEDSDAFPNPGTLIRLK